MAESLESQKSEDEEQTNRRVKRVSWHVLPASMSGGPKGLGDPDDKSLREVERTILIPNMMKDKIKKNYCHEAIVDFENCARDNGLMMPFKCRGERDVLKDCMAKWLDNEEIRKECTEKYLEKRTKYRETGIGEPMKKKFSTMV